jgi:Transcriptional regulatory protein, C terminal
MFQKGVFKRIVFLLIIHVVSAMLASAQDPAGGALAPDKVNLALRRTADKLLRLSGDSTSLIPAVEQRNALTWRVLLKQPFNYDELPALLEESLNQYNIQVPYEVKVRRYDDETIDLGYHRVDLLKGNEVPCQSREMTETSHFIEITFLQNVSETPAPAKAGNSFTTWKGWVLILLPIGITAWWFYRRKKSGSSIQPSTDAATHETDWLEFGNSRLDVAGQILNCSGTKQALTFRETKLLKLFASSPDQLLERDFILQQVWADEGIMVGRSVDVFVSRLRKKLATDTSVGIVAVHGVGYRMETRKTE